MEVKVSIIISIYNCEKFLEDCLNSILSQTLKDICLICINDASTDNSWNILKEYELKDERIIVLNNRTNKGSSYSRNLGIKMAESEFVCFMDADDFYPNNDILEKLYCRAKENEAMICGGSFSELNKKGNIIVDFSDRFEGYVFKEEGWINYSDYQFDFGYHRFIYNTKFLKKNNLYFPNYRRYQDVVFFVKAMDMSKKFYAITDITYRYRRGHQINKVNWDAIKWNDQSLAIKDILVFAKEKGYDKLYKLTYQHGRAIAKEFIKNMQEGEVKLSYLYNLNKALTFTDEEEKNFLELMDEDFEEIQNQIKKTKIDYQCIKNSYSFKIGRILTLIPRKIKRKIQNKKT